MKILLTGASGFLGSHVAEVLHERKHELLLTKRINSNLWRCSSFIDHVKWCNTDDNEFEDAVSLFQPEVIINLAWDGVFAQNRELWNVQIDNLQYQQNLLNIARKIKIKKIIGMGSQAEYGLFNGYIDESYSPKPNSAYGAVKLAAKTILQTFCETNDISWYWFRLFSCFGERESEHWLIPSVIKTMCGSNKMDLTFGEQQYAYLYVKDVANVFASAVETNPENGVYHIASDKLYSLKCILLKIKEYLNPDFNLNFGAIPYRENQSMISGSINSKTKHAFGIYENSDFDEKLIQTIEYYMNLYNDK
jgi:nucleoside-diphosphate-sugar epimerase